MKCVPFSSDVHLGYMRVHLPFVGMAEGQKGIVCETDEGVPTAICIMEKWTKNSVWVHLAVTHPAALRTFLHEVAYYIFVTCRRKTIFGSVPSDNHKALKLNRHLGYEVYQVIPDYYEDGVDCVVVRMDKEDCRFLIKAEEKAVA